MADATPKAPERIYTLVELASVTGRSRDFWWRQCRSGALAYIQPVANGTILIPESAYDAWFERSLARTSVQHERQLATVAETERPRSDTAWVDVQA